MSFTVQLEGDIHIINGIYRSVKLMAESSEQPVYYFRFSIDTPLNMLRKVLPITSPGECVCKAIRSLCVPKDLQVRRMETSSHIFSNPSQLQQLNQEVSKTYRLGE